MTGTTPAPETTLPAPLRDPDRLLTQTLSGWQAGKDLWVFGYASLIWRPEFDHVEQRPATVHGYHRALKMWSRVNRGTPSCPGLVFALLSGGSCKGMVFRIPAPQAESELRRLWLREMPTGVYDPRWLSCRTVQGPVRALAFTLSRRSPNYTGQLQPETLRHIFAQARGRYGSTLDYLLHTEAGLRAHGLRDRGIESLLRLAGDTTSKGSSPPEPQPSGRTAL